jgi:hypothetical protein
LETDRQARLAWSVSRLIREGYGTLSLRKAVLADPVLTGTTLADILGSSDGLREFVAKCEAVPGCGNVQREAIAAAIVTEMAEQARIGTLLAVRDTAHSAPPLMQAVTDDPEASAVALIGRVYPRVEGLEDVCRRLWDQQPARRFFYMPTRLPDCIKSPALIAAEGGKALTPLTGSHLWPMSGAIDAGARKAVRGLIVFDRQALAAITARCGRYADLSLREVDTQMLMLRRFCDSLAPGIEAIVTDFVGAGITPGAILGDQVIMPGPDGCTVFDHPPGLSRMVARCEAARTTAQPLAEVLAQDDALS